METDQLSQLSQFFENKPEIALAFLFGSQAKGYARQVSDFDIAVWFKDNPTLRQIDQLWLEVERLVQREVDLVVLNSARPTVAWAALRGKRLLIRDWKLFINLVLNVSTEAEDMQDFNLSLWKRRQKLREEAK
jgi:predicted nucleotidyltransferase